MGIENSKIAIIKANSFIFLLLYYFTTMVDWLCVRVYVCKYLSFPVRSNKSATVLTICVLIVQCDVALLKDFKNKMNACMYILIGYSHFDPFIPKMYKIYRRFNTHTHILHNYLHRPLHFIYRKYDATCSNNEHIKCTTFAIYWFDFRLFVDL